MTRSYRIASIPADGIGPEVITQGWRCWTPSRRAMAASR